MLNGTMAANIDDGSMSTEQENLTQKKEGSLSNNLVQDEATLDVQQTSAEKDKASVKRQYKSSDKNATFIEKLWEVLHKPEYKEAIYWSKNGQSFRIEPKMFYATSLNSNEFQGCKFESFLRRLLRWGFERVILEDEFPINAFVYQHTAFKSGHPDLINQFIPPNGAKSEAKKQARKKQKKNPEADVPTASSVVPQPTHRSVTNEESKISSPANELDNSRQGILSQLMPTRQVIPNGSFVGIGNLNIDRHSLVHSLGGTASDPINLLLQRNSLSRMASSNLSSAVTMEQNLLARQLLAQQNEDVLLSAFLRTRSQMQSDALLRLRSDQILSNSAAALSLAPTLGLFAGSGALAQTGNSIGDQTEFNPNLYLRSFPQESPQLNSATVLEALRRGQISVSEAEMLLRQIPLPDLDGLNRFLSRR